MLFSQHVFFLLSLLFVFFLKHHNYNVEKECIPLSSSAFILAKLVLFAKMNGVTA